MSAMPCPFASSPGFAVDGVEVPLLASPLIKTIAIPDLVNTPRQARVRRFRGLSLIVNETPQISSWLAIDGPRDPPDRDGADDPDGDYPQLDPPDPVDPPGGGGHGPGEIP